MRRREILKWAGSVAAWPFVAHAQAREPAINVGVLTDMSGLYAPPAGAGSVAAAEMAVHDFGGEVLGKKIASYSAITCTRSMSLLRSQPCGLMMNTWGPSSICRTQASRWLARSLLPSAVASPSPLPVALAT